MNKKILIVICLVFFIFSIAGVSAADANQTSDSDDFADTLAVSLSDRDVLSVSDDINVIGAKDDGTFTALKKKIDDAPEGSSITLENDYCIDSQIEISKALTILGNGHSINISDVTVIFDICSDGVILDNINFDTLTIEDGAYVRYVGDVAISLKGNNCSITNCAFTGYGADEGGAVYLCGDNCSLINCTFKDNEACQGGAIYLDGDDCSLINCTFTNNMVERKSAASINYFTGEGGAAYLKGNGCSVINCTFAKNEANLGGAIYLSGGNSSIIRCTFTNNLAFSWHYTVSKKGIPYSFNGGAEGGAVRLSGDNCSIIRSTFKNNMASSNEYCSGEGGAIFWKGNDGLIDYCSYTKMGYSSNGLSIYGDVFINEDGIDVPDVIKDYGGPEKLEITLTEDDEPIVEADVNININGSDYTKTTDIYGKTSLDLDLNAGTYDATVTYGNISAVAKVTVNQLNTTNILNYEKTSYNSVNLIAIVNPKTAKGDVVFTVNGIDYAADRLFDGKPSRILSNLAAGNYEAKAYYKGDVNHKASASQSVSFTVEEGKYSVSAPDLTKYYKGPERFVVTVKEKDTPVVGKEVLIYLNGVPYKRTTNGDGQASMAITLNSGKYDVTSEFEGIKADSTITVNPTVSGSDVTKIYRNGTQYYATFIDTNGDVLKNTPVEFNINGIFYTRTTNDQGVAKMNINLNPGEYIITSTNPNSTEMYSNTVRVLPNIVDNHDLTKYYRNDSQYVIKLLDDEGNPVGAGVTMKFNINGVFYTRTTNATGHVKMNVNLAPGEYIITAEYDGYKTSNVIKVLPILEARDLNMKYRDGSRFEVKLVDGEGKAFAGQKITFNINGVFYERMTGDDGIARLNINLMAGEYIITSMYENGAAISNKVTIRS